jgi:hypothetical protein
MTGTLTKEKIEQLAPDQTSLSAALKLVKPANWPTLGINAADGLLWGECQGSGSTPYRISLATADLGYKCTCPSRKFPCKHTLALMLQSCNTPDRFVEGDAPEWVNDWIGRRRGKTPAAAAAETKPQEAPNSGKTRGGSIAIALAEAPVEAPPSPKAAARAEAQSQRLRQEREASVLDGVANLELWIADQLGHGLAGFSNNASQTCRAMAARLVDAKAGGLASLLDQLAADVFRVPDTHRADLVVERLAALALLAAAYRRQDALPPALRADLRRAVGWSVKRADLLGDADALRVSAPWMVIAAHSEVQPDKLRRLETWLMRLDAPPADKTAPASEPSAGAAEPPRFALLLDYLPVADRSGSSPFTPGELLLAEMVFYPSATPLRAQIGARDPVPHDPMTEMLPWPDFPAGVGSALDAYEQAVTLQPWLDAWPVGASGLRVEQDGAGGLLIAGEDGAALPLKPSQFDFAAPLLAFDSLTAAGLWDGRAFTLFAAQTPLGLWRDR